MKKLLFIVTESRSANGICTKAVMRACVQRGLEVYCLTNREYGEAEKYEVDGITFYTVKPRLYYRLDACLNSGAIHGFPARLLRLANTCMGKAKLLLTCPTWPLISPAYANRIYRRAKKVCADVGIDTIIPIYTQIDTLIAANRIKKEQPQICYIPYFLDSFSGGYGPKVFSREWTIKRGLKWEAKLLPRADQIIMMQSAKAHYQRYSADAPYYARIRFLDLPLFSAAPEVRTKDTLLPRDAINLVYVGSIPAHIRDPRYFIDLFHAIWDDRLRLTIIGSSTCGAYLNEMAAMDPRIRLIPPVDHNTALAAMEAADILVNLGNNNARMTPSKIFEYMSFGKPILSTAPIPEEPSLTYLRDYPCKFIVDESKDLSYNAEQVRHFIDSSYTCRVDAAALAERFWMNAPEAFVQCICEEDKNP